MEGLSVGQAQRDFSIRPATNDDSSAVRELWTQAYVTEGEGGRDDPYTEAEFAETAERGEVFVAEREGEVVGVVALLPPGGGDLAVAVDGEAELARLAVAPAARRGGVGDALVERCERHAREAGWDAIALWSRPYQHAGHRLYERRVYRRAPERDSVDEIGFGRFVFHRPLLR
jgi:ribosomal protein S18 acetylase RimI-like enzyme